MYVVTRISNPVLPKCCRKAFRFLSGLPERKRRRKLLMPIQAYIDDSGSKGAGKFLILAGLVAKAETFALLADAWEAECAAKTHGSIRYFKTDEARDLSGEFKYWHAEARDAKLLRLISVIKRHPCIVVWSGVDLYAHGQFERVTNAVLPPPPTRHHERNQPYLMCFTSVVLAASLEALAITSSERAEIIFDVNHHFKKDAIFAYRDLLQNGFGDRWKAIMPYEPLFRDDKDFVVLQCADLLASHIRLIGERDRKWPSDKLSELGRLKVSRFSAFHSSEDLRHMAESRLKMPVGTEKPVQYVLPIQGTGIVISPPLAYLGMDQPLVSYASRASLPEAARRWVFWDQVEPQQSDDE